MNNKFKKSLSGYIIFCLSQLNKRTIESLMKLHVSSFKSNKSECVFGNIKPCKKNHSWEIIITNNLSGQLT